MAVKMTFDRFVSQDLKCLMHFLAFLAYSFATYYAKTYLRIPKENPYHKVHTNFGGDFQFLTVIGVVRIH